MRLKNTQTIINQIHVLYIYIYVYALVHDPVQNSYLLVYYL